MNTVVAVENQSHSSEQLDARARLLTAIAFITPLILTASELLVWKFPQFGRTGNWIWALSFLFPAIFILRQFSWLAHGALRLESTLSFASILLLTGLYFYRLDSLETSRFAAGELHCALRQLSVDPTGGFLNTCNWGNPTRQFLIPAIPSRLLTHGPFALALGHSIYFVLGIIAFASGALRWLGVSRKHDVFVATTLVFLLNLKEFWRLSAVYEQVNFPLCFALMLVGLAFHFAHTPNKRTLSIFGITVIHCAFIYHPAIALFLGSLVALPFLVLTKYPRRGEAKLYLGIFLPAALILFLSALKFRIMELFNQKSGANFSDQVTRFFDFALWQHQSPILLSPLLHQLVLFTLLFALLRPKKYVDATLALWIIAAAVASVFSRGNWDFEVINIGRVDRINLAIPVALALMLRYVKEFDLARKISWAPAFVVFFLAGSGGFAVYRDTDARQRNFDGEIMMQMRSTAHQNSRFTIFIEPGLPSWEFGQGGYYFPKANQVVLPENCVFEKPATPFFVLISAKGKCASLKEKYSNMDALPVQMFNVDLNLLIPANTEDLLIPDRE